MSAFTSAVTNGVVLYFNEKEHTYKDNAGNKYTSCTTITKKYEPYTDWRKIAGYSIKKPGSKYYGWTIDATLADWDKLKDAGCAIGNIEHDYMEDAIKDASGYKKIAGTKFINDKIYTIQDVIIHPKYGNLDLDYFAQKGIREKYPTIYSIIEGFVKKGYRIYSEIGAYDFNTLTSGLIDVLFIRDDEFCILDWKTNADAITNKCGYFAKDKDGNRTTDWIDKLEYYQNPINHILHSSFAAYTLQLSIYTYLVETFGLRNRLNVLCHIRRGETNGVKQVDVHNIPYWKKEVELLLPHHYSTHIKVHQSQLQLNLI
jgi:hypothetical protein